VMTDDPARFAAGELTRLLRARGVAVGEPAHGVAPDGAARVASVTSQPLQTIVAWMLATSDNTTAEMLTKELGVRARSEGSTAAGVLAIRAKLRELGVDLGAQTMIDGSGLDRQNRISCRALAGVLELGGRPDLHVLRDVLPGAARAKADGQIYAKGGYLTDVTGLTGIVARDTPLQVAFLVNGGVPKNANADLARISGVLTTYQPPTTLGDDVVPTPAPSRGRRTGGDAG
jgi:PBP4 family serine-type D-alanyl-D-alanine carboxypeptidase